jgi:hypothetical protein
MPPCSTKREDRLMSRLVNTTPRMTMHRLATLLTSRVCLALGSTPLWHMGHSQPLTRSMVTTLEQEMMAESAVDIMAAKDPISTIPPTKISPAPPVSRRVMACPKKPDAATSVGRKLVSRP